VRNQTGQAFNLFPEAWPNQLPLLRDPVSDYQGDGGIGALLFAQGDGGIGALLLATSQGDGGIGALLFAQGDGGIGALLLASALRPIALVKTSRTNTTTSDHLDIDPSE
jgi:hypothetical protein